MGSTERELGRVGSTPSSAENMHAGVLWGLALVEKSCDYPAVSETLSLGILAEVTY